MTALDLGHILSASTPWCYLLICHRNEADDVFFGHYGDRNPALRVIRGSRCRTKAALFQEFAAAFQFPWYFGHNWMAFDECMADFWWLNPQAIVVYITDFNFLFDLEPEDVQTLFYVLKRTHEWWSVADDTVGMEHRAMPFAVVFQVSSEFAESTEALVHSHGIALSRL